MVLWTRIATDPFDGGTGRRQVPVKWEIAADGSFRRVVRKGMAHAGPELGYSVHVEVHGLQPATTYWYRFKSRGVISPVGRTRTAPAAGASPQSLSFAFASCQQWQQGYYTAYRHMAEQDLDLVFHLGDYIYEGDHSTTVRPALPPEPVRPEPMDLAS